MRRGQNVQVAPSDIPSANTKVQARFVGQMKSLGFVRALPGLAFPLARKNPNRWIPHCPRPIHWESWEDWAKNILGD